MACSSSQIGCAAASGDDRGGCDADRAAAGRDADRRGGQSAGGGVLRGGRISSCRRGADPVRTGVAHVAARRRLMFSSRDLYRRGMATLVASWEAYAGGSAGAAVIRSPGLAAAVFPSEPARAVYNNALLARGLGPAERMAALDAAEATYAAAGVGRFAAWVHESDEALRRDVAARGYTLDTATRSMGVALADLRVPRPDIDVARADRRACPRRRAAHRPARRGRRASVPRAGRAP